MAENTLLLGGVTGNTLDFGSGIPGSSPGRAARKILKSFNADGDCYERRQFCKNSSESFALTPTFESGSIINQEEKMLD